MTVYGLTPLQKRVMDFIVANSKAGVPPSYREIMAATGINSPSTVHHVVYALAERGYINMLPKRRRSISVNKGCGS